MRLRSGNGARLVLRWVYVMGEEVREEGVREGGRDGGKEGWREGENKLCTKNVININKGSI